MNYFRTIIKYLLPYGVYNFWRAYKEKKMLQIRAERLRKYSKLQSEEFNLFRTYDYEESVRVLVSRELNENEIRSGSIPEKDLIFLTSTLKRYLSDNEKLTLLHIGNFVGISLCYIANFVRNIHEDGLVLAIDPNIQHRGIVHPEDYVKNLISYFQLDKNILLIDAFSLGKNPKNDAGVLYTNELGLQIETGCSYSLNNIAKIAIDRFDICIIDGNHESEYLMDEISSVFGLMKSGGFIVIDDVLFWEDVRRVFVELQSDKHFQLIASNERIGILKVLK